MTETLHTNFRWALTGERQQMLVRDGHVIERAWQVDSDAPTVDHGGRRLIPSFLDNHCHILPSGIDLLHLSLADTSSAAEALEKLHERHRDVPDGWLFAVQYDQNRYGGVHLTRHELDRVSRERPIFLRHANGHGGVANSAALLESGIDPSTPDPEGGTIVRDASGFPTGVLLEVAMQRVYAALPPLTVEIMTEAILRAGQSMRDFGICCAADMQTGTIDVRNELIAYGQAAKRGCKVETRLYLQWESVYGPKAIPRKELDDLMTELEGTTCHVCGIKLFSDGALGTRTAAIYGAYQGDDKPDHGDHSGLLIHSAQALNDMVATAARDGWQVSVHAIGDYATDLVIDAYRATDRPDRHRIEHAMMLSDRQIEELAELGCHVCFQPEFLHRFRGSYFAQLGAQRASSLNRTRSALDAGVNLSFSSDRPIVSGDPWVGIRAAVGRDGFDSSERCTESEAIELYTARAARPTGDQVRFGTLSPGSRADFLLLEA